MNKKKIIELLNKEIDGVLTEKERQALETILAVNEEARIIRTDLHAISRQCADTGRKDPPSGLRPAVRRAIEELHAVAPRPRRLTESLVRLIPPRRELRLVYAFVGGVALGAVFFALVTNMVQRTTINDEDLLGSMIQRDSAGSAWTTYSIVTPAARGRIATQNMGNLDAVLIQLDCRGPAEAQLRLDLGSRVVRLVSRPEDAIATLEVRPGHLIVRGNQLGELRLVLSRPASVTEPLHLTLFDGEVPVYQHDLLGTDGAVAAPEK